MIFKELPKAELEQVTTDNGRYYQLPSGERFDSVTTILKNADKSNWLQDWRNRIGEDVADEITRLAAARGNALHQLMEDTVRGLPFDVSKISPFAKKNYETVKLEIERRVKAVYGMEMRCYSRKLRAAGTLDLFCEWDGVPTIVDYKTAKRPKTDDQIPHYFIQASVYALMMLEMFKIKVPRIAIIVVPDYDEPQIFHRNTMDYVPQIKRIFIDERKPFEQNP